MALNGETSAIHQVGVMAARLDAAQSEVRRAMRRHLQSSEDHMRIPIKLGLFALSTMVAAAPALAGEITGSGKDLPVNGRSLCAYSGQNDTPDGLWLPIGPGGALVQVDPGGDVQSYGFFKSQKDFIPSPSDPAARAGFSFPGTSCNPNRSGGE
jgi:hypothetical protein